MPVLRKIGQNNKISLATLLSGLVSLSVLLTLTILLIASYQSKKQSLYDTTLTLNYSKAMKMGQTMDSLFQSMRSSLQYNAGFFANYQDMSEIELNKNLEFMRRSSYYFNSVAIVDETGFFRGMTPPGSGTVGKAITTDSTKEALGRRKPYLSKPYIAATGRFIVFMSEPIYDKDGNFRGVIGGSIYLQDNNIMNMIFGSNETDDVGSYFYVVGSDGHLLYHPDKNRISEDVSANPVVRQLMQGKSGQEMVVNTRGIALLAGYSAVRENGWGVVVASPIRVVNQELKQQTKNLLLVTLPPFLLLLVVANWLARRLARPFVSLAKLASRIRRDHIDVPIARQHWNREADLLNRTIMHTLSAMQKQTEQLAQAAMTDPLTGLLNRRGLEELMTNWIAEARDFSIVVMDIDRFKSINDTVGHQAGDEVLKHLAGILTDSARAQDICCRLGGEEFVLLLSRASTTEAYAIAEHIRTTLQFSANPIGKPVTVSLGISHYPSQSDTVADLFQKADQALYRAKETGRNRTIVA